MTDGRVARPAGAGRAPAAVFRVDTTWRWECRRCHRSEWRPTFAGALGELAEHQHRHATFGFGGK